MKTLLDGAASVIVQSALIGPDSHMPMALHRGTPKLLVVVGDNATGKSLFVRVLRAYLVADEDGVREKDAPTVLMVSIRERTGATIEGFQKAMMFGDEAESSTGANSIRVVQTAFHSAENYERSALIFDEPEMGLSDSYAGAMGTYIAQRAGQMPTGCLGTVVVTHSKALVAAMLAQAGELSIVLAGSDEPTTAGSWVQQATVKSVDELLALPDIGHHRWRSTQEVLNSFRS